MSKTISATTRKRLDVQGMCDVDDATMASLTPWHRMSFTLCGLIAGVGTVLASPTILFALVPIAVLGILFPVHPFDLIYNIFIRPLRKTGPLPKRGAPVRFACAMGGTVLIIAGLCFQNGYNLVGYILGGMMLFMSSLVTFADVCVASYIYQGLFGRKKATA